MLEGRNAIVVLLLLSFVSLGWIQGAAQDAKQQTEQPSIIVKGPRSAVTQRSAEHRFGDRTNLSLFAGVAAVRALDYSSTRHFRARGVDEAMLSNAVVDNKPLFLGIEAAATAASIGLSYWMHRKGHHKIERWISIVHVGVGGFGDARNYTLGNSPPLP